MKVKCVNHETIFSKQFFLLMIVPVLIGLMIAHTSFAYAEWHQKDDPLLFLSPLQQGWVQVNPQHSPSNLLKSQKNPLKTAYR